MIETEENPGARAASSRTERVLDALFRAHEERAHVYAVLDGARDERIYYEVHRGARAYACLFAGKVDPALATAAPWVVPLDRDAPFTRRIVDIGWGRSFGVFVISRAPLEDMRRHLRRFLVVGTEGGRQLFFRYFDPRVLRPYLPTCEPRELAYVFGPILRWVYEADAPNTLVSATRAGDLLELERVAV